ncbi:HTH_Tnp_Tc3_2 domain-containing protein [Trichonephila clavipes]|nr:HTH_Tnp_Tc3_2 domain-containing protein [Trichonephila clavipes]
MPLRRNRRQYEQLTDFDRGPYNKPKQVGRIDVSAATSVGRYGSCSVLATPEVGLRSRRPLRRLPLTPHHRQCRLDFADLNRLEVRLQTSFLSADDHRTFWTQRPAVRSGIYRAAYYVTVWGAIFWDTRSSLVVLQGTLTARRYVDDILTPIVLPMLSSRPGAIYQHNDILRDSPNNVFKDMTSYHGLPGHQFFANRACLRRAGKANCSRPEIQEN